MMLMMIQVAMPRIIRITMSAQSGPQFLIVTFGCGELLPTCSGALSTGAASTVASVDSSAASPALAVCAGPGARCSMVQTRHAVTYQQNLVLANLVVVFMADF